MTNYDVISHVMKELEFEIYKQIVYCVGIKKFRSAICIASEDKKEIVKELLMKIIKENTLQYRTKFYTSCHNIYVEFANGSNIKVFVPNKDVRGIRFNSCIIDNEFFDTEKEELIYSKIMPLIDFNKEPIDFLNEMLDGISIVRIGGNINAGT